MDHIHFEQTSRIKFYILILAIIWTLLLLASLTWSLYGSNRSAIMTARIEARASFNKDLLYRRWASIHGGVYVPVTVHTPSNPFLKVPNRDVITTDGQSLTLINPAYMTRQVYELAETLNGTYGHITSLNPIRPGNSADEWETQALQAFEQGVPVVSSVETVDGVEVLRYMEGMVTDDSCLKCHADQGYELGDIRGGISVSVPIQPYRNAERPVQRRLILGHSLLWLAGLTGIGLSSTYILAGFNREALIVQQLQERDMLFRAFIDQSNDAIVLNDTQGNVVEWNKAQETITGILREEVVGKPIWLAQQSVADTCDDKDIAQRSKQLETMIRQALTGEMLPWFSRLTETRIRRSDNSQRDIQSMIFPIETPNGRMLGSITRDITEQKLAHQREIELTLEKERRQLLTAFIQNASHEFRTPLAIINSNAYLMARLDDAQRRQQKADQTKFEVNRINNIVDMLILMAQIEGNGCKSLMPVDLWAILDNICRTVTNQYDKKHTIHINIQTDLPPVMGNADCLSNAFKQLVENACRFTPANGTITLATGHDDNHVWFEVQDSGPGIAGDDLPYIFDTFWRLDDAHSISGFGLGLSVTQKIVEQHNGQIVVESVVGTGSTFRMILPCIDTAPSVTVPG